MRQCHALRAAGGSAHTPPHTSGRVQQHPVSLVNREEVKEGEREADQESFHITSAAAAADRLGGVPPCWYEDLDPCSSAHPQQPADSTVNLLITECCPDPPVLLFKWRHMTLSCSLPSPHLCASYWPPAHSSLPPSLRAHRQNHPPHTHTSTGP